MAISTQALLLAIVAGVAGAVAAPSTGRRAATAGVHARDVLSLILPSGAAMGVWALVLVLLMSGGSISMFEVMAFVYLAAVVAAPMTMLGVLAAERWSTTDRPIPPLTRPAHACAIAVLLLAPIGVYASRIEPRNLVVERVDVALPGDVAGDHVVRVGVISDIQTIAVGPHEREAVRRLLDEEPDVVLIAGDLFQGTANQWAEHADAYRELLRQLDSVPHGAFVVGGDVDSDAVPSIIDGTGVSYLRSEVAEVTVGDRVLRVLGVPLEPDAEAEAALDAFATEARDGAAHIVLAHRPDWAQRFGRGGAGVDLVVAGHTHGGQVQLPLVGPLITMTSVPRSVAAGGLHDVAGQLLYVSTGVGMEQQGAPQIRFGARPSVALLTLR